MFSSLDSLSGYWQVPMAESNYSVIHQETLAVMWVLRHFIIFIIIIDYPIVVHTVHIAIKDLFQGCNLSDRLERWYLTIQEFNSKFKYTYLVVRINSPMRLSRNVAVRGIVEDLPQPSSAHVPVNNFSLEDLADTQSKNDLWAEVV